MVENFGCDPKDIIAAIGPNIGACCYEVDDVVLNAFKEAEFDIMFGKGISKVGDIVDLASNIDIINKSGAWYAYEGNKIGQGRENTKIYLEEHPDICQEIEDKVRAYYDFEKNGEENEDN